MIDFTKTSESGQSDFYETTEQADQYFLNNSDSSEGGSYAKFERWKTFWRDRVNKLGEPKGSFLYAQEAALSVFANPICVNGGINTSPWQELGPFENTTGVSTPNLGQVTAVALDPNNHNIAYAGVVSSGIWKTTNALSQVPDWTNVVDYLRVPMLGINDIKIAPSNSNIIYAGTGSTWSGGYGVGVLKSTDAGATWNLIGPVDPGTKAHCRKLVIDPNNPNKVYVVAIENVYKTTDGGATWNDVFELPYSIGQDPYSPNSPARLLVDIEIDPINSDIIYISSNCSGAAILLGNNNGSLMYRSVDGGASWNSMITEVNGTLSQKIDIAVTPAAPGSVWVLYRDYSTNVDKIWRSDDEGMTWSLVSGPNLSFLYGGHWRQDLTISPTDPNVMYDAAAYAFKSIDGGFSFTQQASGQHIDCRTIVVVEGSNLGSNGTNDLVIQGNDGGISLTQNGGANWESINGYGFSSSMFFGIGISEIEPIIVGGRQDNSLAFWSSGQWYMPILFQDGADATCHLTDANIVYGQKWCCQDFMRRTYIYKRTNGVWNQEPGFYRPNEVSHSIRPIFIADDGYLYTGYEEVHRSLTPTDPPTLSFSALSAFADNFTNVPANRPLQSISVCDNDPNTMFAAFHDASWGQTPAGYVFRTTTGGGIGANDWEDITANLPTSVTHNLPITGVFIHPRDPQKVWITVSGYANDLNLSPPFDGHWRVIRSLDGGDTWSDYSEGLTPFVVNDLVYQEGTDDGLYIATDVGVFYRDASMPQWECYNSGLVTAIISDLEIDHCQKKLVASTLGRGVWMTDLVESQEIEENIVGNITIDSPRRVASTIRIQNGSILTIQADLRFHENAGIIVEPGAKLVIDGATLTNKCSELWDGVIVLGDATLPQIPSSNQGDLIVKNGGTIENAKVAVQLFGTDANGDPDMATTGGIVRTYSGAEFRNNLRDVWFKRYENIYNGSALSNRSRFSNTTFTVNNERNDQLGYPEFVRLQGVSGIKFSNCQFRFDDLAGPGINRPNGIVSFSSRFTVSNSTFYQLGIGIRAGDYTGYQTCYIRGNTFTSNDRGILLTGVNFAEITSNVFTVPTGAGSWPLNDDILPYPIPYGIYLYGCTGYEVEENTLSSINGVGNDNVGIIVKDNEQGANELYRNDMDGLYVGLLLQGDNRDESINNGVQSRCNDFGNIEGCSYDIAVTDKGEIAPFQGDMGLNPAGNRFYPECIVGTDETDIFVVADAPSGFSYIHHTQDYTDPECSTNSFVLRVSSGIPYEDDNDPNPSCLVDPSDGTLPAEINLKFNNNVQQFVSLKAYFDGEVDAGDHEFLMALIEDGSVTSFDLRTQLLAASPKLTDKIMIAALNREVPMDDLHISQVLIANSPLTPDVQLALDKSAVSEYYRNLVRAAQNGGLSLKSMLQAELSSLRQTLETARYDATRRYIQRDSIGQPIDSLFVLFNDPDVPLRSEHVLALYFAKEDWTTAGSWLNDPISYGLTLDEADVLNVVKDVLEYPTSAQATVEASSGDLATEVDGVGLTSTASRVLLMEFQNDSFEEAIELPNTSKKLNSNGRKGTESESAIQLDAFPNPATDILTVNIVLEDGSESASLILYDAQGKEVTQRNIGQKVTILELDLISLPAGLYNVVCRSGKGGLSIKTLTILR